VELKLGSFLNEDRQLIEESLAGDTLAFGEIVKRYQRPIYFLSLRMVKNPETADEITQKTFLKAYRALGGFQFKSSLKTWLSAIAMNLCRTELMRPKRPTVPLPEQIPDRHVEDLSEKEELQHQRAYLRQALEALPLRQREVVTLRIYQELPFKDVAEALNSTESAVKVNFHHAMKGLKSWVRKRLKNDAL